MPDKKTFCLNLIRTADLGVLAFDSQDRVNLCNFAAGRMLGLDCDRLTGESFSEAFAAELEQGTELFRLIQGTLRGGSQPQGMVIPYERPQGDTINLRLDFVRMPGEVEGGGGLAVIIADVTKSEQAKLQGQRRREKLASEQRRLQAEKTDLELRIKGTRRVWLWASLALVFLILGAAYYTWSRTHVVPYLEQLVEGKSAQPGSQPNTVAVRKQPLSSSISLSGAVEPFVTVNVLSPFAGQVLARHFNYGQKVGKGKLLIELDTSDLEFKLREAEVTAIKALNSYNKVENWETGDEVLRARRALIKAKNDLQETRQKLKETQMLYKKDIVPLDQYRSLLEQVANQKLSLKTLQDQLKATLRKGSKDNLEVAELQLKNARAKLALLRNQIKKGRITAPVMGVLLKPASQSNKHNSPVEQGYSVEKGQVLVSVGNLERLSVKTMVGELNVGKLKPGQEVVITSYAIQGLNLVGRISQVSSQAARQEGQGLPSFEVLVVTQKLTEKQREQIKLGMTVNLEVRLFSKADTLVLPIGAVREDGTGRYAVTLLEPDGNTKRVPVETGLTTMGSVEITKGLKAGQKVVLPQAAGPAGDQP